jgi:hypothetical protein
MAEDADRTLTVSKETFTRIQNRLSHTEFNSVDEYAEYVLDELILYVNEQVDVSDTEDVDEEEIKERLRSLGYLRD